MLSVLFVVALYLAFSSKYSTQCIIVETEAECLQYDCGWCTTKGICVPLILDTPLQDAMPSACYNSTIVNLDRPVRQQSAIKLLSLVLHLVVCVTMCCRLMSPNLIHQ